MGDPIYPTGTIGRYTIDTLIWSVYCVEQKGVNVVEVCECAIVSNLGTRERVERTCVVDGVWMLWTPHRTWNYVTLCILNQ